MVILKQFLLSILSLSQALAVPAPSTTQPRAACTSPTLRKSWNAATTHERASYINAVLCLKTKPSRIGLSTSPYDDFPYVHNALNENIHGVAAFMPWHRYFVHVYEGALQECGYTGTAMYWDWVADSDAPASSEVFSPTTGFGGNGTATPNANNETFCVTDGPFKDLRPVYWYNDTAPHCLKRNFFPAVPGHQEMLGWQYNEETVQGYTNLTTFEGFRSLEGGPHGVIHFVIGGADVGDMAPLTSPNDPLFFMHHTQVDRLWWLWQQVDPVNRTNDYSGNRFDGSAAELTDIMPMMSLAKNRAVADFMSTATKDLCYKY